MSQTQINKNVSFFQMIKLKHMTKNSFIITVTLFIQLKMKMIVFIILILVLQKWLIKSSLKDKKKLS